MERQDATVDQYLDALCNRPLSTEVIARKVGQPYGQVKRSMNQLVGMGLAIRTGSGMYKARIYSNGV